MVNCVYKNCRNGRNIITNQMIDAVESRASIINDYVSSAEEYMTAFALGSEVRELLANPNDPVRLQKGKKYTEDFAEVKGIFEGLYIGTPDTYILTHTSQGAIGMTTRSGDSLAEFQNTILAGAKLTNLGIMESPRTGSMILSMYYLSLKAKNAWEKYPHTSDGCYAENNPDCEPGESQGKPGVIWSPGFVPGNNPAKRFHGTAHCRNKKYRPVLSPD